MVKGFAKFSKLYDFHLNQNKIEIIFLQLPSIE